MRRTARTSAVALAAVGLLVAAGSPATAADPPEPTVLATGLAGPLSMDAGPGGTLTVAQSFAGLLSAVHPGITTKATRIGTQVPGLEIGAVSVGADGRITYAENTPEGGALIKERNVHGGTRTIVDLGAAEAALDPDGDTTYGLTEVDPSCAEQVPGGLGLYQGETYSHPYASVTVGGTLYVADAGANTIWQVTGGVATPLVALPPQPVVLPDEVYAGLGAPECAYGTPYAFEAVPTDIEVGPDGWLWITTLPGGPEDPSAGARGALHRIDPATGEVQTVATGFSAATGLAVDAATGDVYVAELFAGQISKVAAGTSTPVPFVSLPMPAAVEISGGTLYASTDVLGPSGSVVSVPLG